jgi:iron complex transport system substrate-binding protein
VGTGLTAGLKACTRSGIAALCGAIAAVHAAPSPPAANLTRGCIDRFEPSTDYFPAKAALEDAASFAVEYRRSYKLVTVKDAYVGGPPERYVLLQCGAPRPPLTAEFAGAQVVPVPITSLFVLSTTHLSLLADLGRMDVLSGVPQRDVVMDARAEARIRAGKIVEFAKVGLQIDVERVVTAKPSLLMAFGPSTPTFSALRAAGVPVVANAEFLEPTALGRAEWVKFMALFLNEERTGQALYAEMKGRYRSLSARAVARPEAERPLVMTGRSTRGLFKIAGGRSYVAALIKDAGGRYAWGDDTSVASASVDLESQIQRAANADVWINGGGWKSLPAMLDDEPRYVAFKAYRQGQVWTYERRQQPNGANDYWTRSVTHPDLLLADLVRIFLPRLTPEHVFEWYMPVPSR